MAKHEEELQHLHEGQVPLPTHRIALDGRIVIGIHEDMNEYIEGAQEEELTSVAIESYYQVSGGWHQDVVENVQKRYLRVLLAQHAEHGVKQVNDLVYVVGIADAALPVLQRMILLQDSHAAKVVRLEYQHEVVSLQKKLLSIEEKNVGSKFQLTGRSIIIL